MNFFNRRSKYVFVVLMLLVVVGVAGAFWWRAAHTYDPIDFTRSQPTVRQPPVFHLKDTITVEALFNNNEDENVTLHAKVYWELKKPPGQAINIDDQPILQFEFNRVLNPGCTKLSFDNVAPDEVKTITARLFSEGYKTVEWEINGTNKVIDPKVGDEITFKTQRFRYYHNSDKLPKFKESPALSCEPKETDKKATKKKSQNSLASVPTPAQSIQPAVSPSQTPNPQSSQKPPQNGGSQNPPDPPEEEPSLVDNVLDILEPLGL